MKLQDLFKKKKEKKNFSAVDAYTTSTICKAVSLDEMYMEYFNDIQNELKSKCRDGNGSMEKYIYHNTYIIKEHKERLIKDLKELGFKVLYSGDASMIVSWAHLKDRTNERKETDKKKVEVVA